MLDPRLLNTFRGRIANPFYWRRTHRILLSYSRYELASPDGAEAMVDQMCGALNVQITPAQRAHAANWIASQRIDPQHPWHQMRMWGVVNGGSSKVNRLKQRASQTGPFVCHSWAAAQEITQSWHRLTASRRKRRWLRGRTENISRFEQKAYMHGGRVDARILGLRLGNGTSMFTWVQSVCPFRRKLVKEQLDQIFLTQSNRDILGRIFNRG